MSLSTSQKFLVQASRVAAAGDYFRCRDIGRTVGLSETQSDEAARSLSERKLLLLLNTGEARLSASGRALAAGLEAKAAGNPPQAAPPLARDRRGDQQRTGRRGPGMFRGR